MPVIQGRKEGSSSNQTPCLNRNVLHSNCRLPSDHGQQESQGGSEAEGDIHKPLDLRCNWEDSSISAAQDVARGKQILEGQGVSPSSNPGYESSRQATVLPVFPSTMPKLLCLLANTSSSGDLNLDVTAP